MNENVTLEQMGDLAEHAGRANARKTAAENAHANGRPDAAQYLYGALTPAHELLLQCMKEAGQFTQVATRVA